MYIHASDDHSLLAQSTEVLMATGGDERLHIDHRSGVSKYYTAPKPCNTIILRSSCTSSFPTEDSFLYAQSRHRLLTQALCENKLDDMFEDLTHQVRLDIQDVFGCKKLNPYVILTPSGTDAEMIFSLMGLARSKQHEKKSSSSRVLNIVLAAGELGGGTALACGLRYFNAYLPNGTKVSEQQLLHGVSEQDITTFPIPARDPMTGIMPSQKQLEKYLEHVISEAIEEKNQYVILHAVHCSKTGMGIPSFEFIKNIKKRYHESLIVVVDMAQMRCSDQTVSQYLQENICVLMTGSKFFEGPAFSGAVLIPQQEGFQFINITDDQLPTGIKSYVTKYEVDTRLTVLRSMLSRDKNIGLFLRWSAALYMIKNVYKIPELIRDTCASRWVSSVQALVEKTPHVELLHGQVANFTLAEPWALLGGVNTIIPVKIISARDKKALSFNQLKKVHAWMARDITDLLPEGVSEREKSVAKQCCLVGQPVLMAQGYQELAVLRIALGASMLLGLRKKEHDIQDLHDIVEQLLIQDHIVLEKLSLIGKYFYQ